VLAARSFSAIAEMDTAFIAWLPIRRGQAHRTHGEVIGVRAEADRFALAPLPPTPYLVADRHLRRAGKDCLVSFEASLYSVPAVKVRAGQRAELRVTADLVAIHALATGPAPGQLLAVHPRAAGRGAWVVDEEHWAGLPDGHTRATIPALTVTAETPPAERNGEANPLAALLTRHQAAALPVARRPLSPYQAIAISTAGAAASTEGS
jgi:hypothetical protein